tara:strand:+ start:8975 stop:9277 length:303 start_codon:yes stop_codon:yes gene_type:complete
MRGILKLLIKVLTGETGGSLSKCVDYGEANLPTLKVFEASMTSKSTKMCLSLVEWNFLEKLPKAIRYKGHHPHVMRTSCHPDGFYPDPHAQVFVGTNKRS